MKNKRLLCNQHIDNLRSHQLRLQPLSQLNKQSIPTELRRVQDVTYQPPAACNFGAPMQQTTKKPETVPKIFPPIYNPFVEANIYKRSMDAPITVTQRKLLSLAPEVCSQVRLQHAALSQKTPPQLRTYTKTRTMNKWTTISIHLL